MALVLADRVRETTTTAGTGTITLLGAVPSCQSFAVVGNGNTTYYTIVAQSGTEWEVGIGTYTASGTTLSRDTVLSSSNSGSLVNFSAGTKDVFVDYPAGKAVYENAAGNVDGYPITGGTINNTTIGATTPSTGVFTTLTATGQTSLGGAAGAEGLRVLTTASAVQRVIVKGQTSGGSGSYIGSASTTDTDVNLIIGAQNAGAIRFSTARASDGTLGADQMRVSHTASAVNYVQVTGSVTNPSVGTIPTISVQGSDASTYLGIGLKGTGGYVSFYNNGSPSATTTLFRVRNATGTLANYFSVYPSIAGNAPYLAAEGSDTNISQVFQTKGTGAIDLAAGSSGVNISNGGTVTAITRTISGSGYTSIPSAVISAPTTAGGTQATLSPGMAGATATVVAGGSGYTVGDTLTIVGSTGTASQLTVATLSGSAVATVTFAVSGNMTALPTNPVSVTGGTGSGATFTMTYALAATQSSFTAGSGYVEQPTVTFSGGGGSGAAAYATVGGTPVIKGLGTNLDVFTANANRAFRFYDSNSTGSNFWSASNGTTPVLYATGSSNTSAAIITNGTGSVSFQSAGGASTQMLIAHTASAVNYVQVTGAATTPTLAAVANITFTGSDTNVAGALVTKGSSTINFAGGGASGVVAFGVSTTNASQSGNSIQAEGSGAGQAPLFRPISNRLGSDANISMAFQSKGTGAIDLAAGSSGVNISNGGTVTALTRTSGGSAYTSFPSVAITAPTTAGGVQATATVTRMFNSTPTIQSGGTGYTVGDVLTIVGGTPVTVAGTYTVATVSAGVITSVTNTLLQAYTALPTNPVSVTGGTGSGATLNLTYQVDPGGLTIGTAGSGYVEQPTVTFSGGGGSGAAAYATVGSIPKIQSLGSAISFATPSGEQFRIRDNTTTAVNYGTIKGSASGSTVDFGVDGADGGITLALKSKGTGGIFLYTAGGNNTQFGVPHTASAVNYVQVTGAATGGTPTISAQGSDTNIPLAFISKGSNGIIFQTRGGGTARTALQLIDSGTASVNYVQAQSNTTGNGPILSALGTDTNIDLTLTPKGTGNVRFGTYTGTISAITGYIEIKDAGGTIRRLAVVA